MLIISRFVALIKMPNCLFISLKADFHQVINSGLTFSCLNRAIPSLEMIHEGICYLLKVNAEILFMS